MGNFTTPLSGMRQWFPQTVPLTQRSNPGIPRAPMAPPLTPLLTQRSNPMGVPRAGNVPPTPAAGPQPVTPTPPAAGAFSPTYGPPAIGNYGVSPTAPQTALGSYGTVVAGQGQSYLPFQMNYLSGASPTGGNYAANYVSQESANQLNQYLAAMGLGGGQVIQGPSYGLPGQASPGEYQIRLQNGQTLDAGGLANIMQRYSPQDAATRINNQLNAPPANTWGASSLLNPQNFTGAHGQQMTQWFAGGRSPFPTYQENPNANTPPSWYTAGTGAPAGTPPAGPPPTTPAAPGVPPTPTAPNPPSATGGNG